ncbi:MAG: pantoate--beta-alanine ligase [Desulfobulbus oligotrophicus]|jgi:pantoate--beta-alanine ligase|nr:pantoate--beta-alanine ligase [Desulfobulbus oligotrophicus]
MMRVIQHPQEMQDWAKAQIRSGATVGLVPTMGFFHEGHLGLMRMAAGLCDLLVVSLFVNPTQFGPNEDLDRYPRDFERDRQLAQKEGVAVVFAPTPELMYPKGFQTEVQVRQLATHLCGKSRPVHFAGVATVVSKLFNIVQADVAVFGEKDFQQLVIVRRLVADLNLPVRIVGHPIVREKDGLAMSSRNANLDPANRAAALSLVTSLQLAQTQALQGQRSTAVLTALLEKHIHSFTGTAVDYVSFVNCETLEPADVVDEQTVLALAVFVEGKVGKVRLIDNGFVLSRQHG